MGALLSRTTHADAGRRARRFRALGLASVAAGAGALVTSVVYGFVTLNGSGTGSASTGSVSLGSPVSTTCNVANLVPGDLTGSRTCSLATTYSGALPAYMSLTVQVQSTKGIGGRPLFDGTNSTGLTLLISDGHTSFLVPTGTGSTGGSCPASYRCWTASNDLAATYSGSTPNLTFANGNAVAFTVTPLFAKTAGNPYQGGSATVTLTVQAVQTGANPLPSGCTTSTIGTPCPASGSFSWS
jgi:hypothetical protein